MNYLHIHLRHYRPIVYYHLATNQRHLPQSTLCLFQCQMGLKHHHHLYLHSQVDLSMRILESRNTRLQIPHQMNCRRSHHCHCLPIAYGCMGIGQEHCFLPCLILLHHNNQAHGYHQRSPYLNLELVSNLLDIYLHLRMLRHCQPNHLGHNHHNHSSPTKMFRHRLHSHR